MKKISLPFIIILMVNIHCSDASSANKTAPEEKYAEIKFRSETIEVGQRPAKKSVTCDFAFSNTGNSPLTITEALGNCHCVQAKWPDKPINPGDSGVINVTFDPTGVTGLFIRTLKVRSNAKRDSLQLTLTGEILPSKQDASSKSLHH